MRYNTLMILDYLKLYPEAFGLDISNLSLKVAKLKKVRGGYHLVSYGEAAIAPGVIEAGEIKKEKELVKAIAKVLKNIHGEKLREPYVVASLPEKQAFLQVVQLPQMGEKEIEHAIRFEAENHIPYPIETVYLDSQIVTPLNNHIDHTDVLLGALPKDSVDSYAAAIQNAGLIPTALDIESVAISRVLAQENTATSPMLIVDMGASRANFIVFSGHSIRFTASINFASKSITDKIGKIFKVKEDKAEQLKRAYGVAVDDEEGKKVAQSVVPLLGILVSEIKRYMEYYESHPAHQHLGKKDQNIKKVVLSGGGTNLRGLTEFLSKELKVEVVLGNPWLNILPSSLKQLPPLAFADSLRYTTVLGLALRGVNGEQS